MSRPDRYGVNSHVIHDAGLEALAQIGVRWHRVSVTWPEIEPVQGQFHWEQVDRVVAAASRLGVSLLAGIEYTPGWASGSNQIAAPARDPAVFLDFVRRAATRYRPEQVAAWSVWNEPNLPQFWSGERDQFVNDFWVPALRAIREAVPGTVLVGPDLSSAHDNRVLGNWLPQALAAARGLLDVVSHHQYDGQDTVAGRVREVERVHDFLVQQGFGDLPLWITEIGWDRVTPEQQGALLRDVMRAMRERPWWHKTFWYDSHGPAWGLLNDDLSPQRGEPRPAFFAYKEIIALLEPPPAAAPDFGHVIELAYQQILGRPADPGGRDHYNVLLRDGLTESAMREAMLRSEEFAVRFPSGGGPPPPPPAETIPPLRVEGNRFTAAGRPINLLGMILCCDDPATAENEAVARGWPAIVDDRTLDFMQQNKLNYVHVRTGPFRLARPGLDDDGETAENVAYQSVGDGRVDLDRWNPAFFERLRRFLAAALARGIYVEVDLVDAWVLDHDLGPWSAGANVNGLDAGSLAVVQQAPLPVHEAWVRKVVRETKAFSNVIYQDGNESWKGAQHVWIHRLRDLVREETGPGAGRRLFGSNARNNADVDYWTYHRDEARPPEEKPVMVTEYPTLPPSVLLAQASIAFSAGTSFHYFRGSHTWAETQQVVAGLKQIIEGQQPFPQDCPRLVKWQPKVHIVMDSRRRLLEDGVPVEGGFVFLDSTPRFSRSGGGNGRPCNNEHNEECQGRPCEDPRGGIWTQTRGNAQVRVENPGTNGHGFQALVGPLGPPGSTYTLRIHALPDARDGLGRPLEVHPNHSRDVSFTVGQSTRGPDSLLGPGDAPEAPEKPRSIPPGVLKSRRRGVVSGG